MPAATGATTGRPWTCCRSSSSAQLAINDLASLLTPSYAACMSFSADRGPLTPPDSTDPAAPSGTCQCDAAAAAMRSHHGPHELQCHCKTAEVLALLQGPRRGRICVRRSSMLTLAVWMCSSQGGTSCCSTAQTAFRVITSFPALGGPFQLEGPRAYDAPPRE